MSEPDQSNRDTEPWHHLEELIAGDTPAAVESYLDSLSAQDKLISVTRLDDDAQDRLLQSLTAEDAAELLDQIPYQHAVDILERMTPEDAARIVFELPSDQQADLLGDLDDSEAEAILAQLDPETAAGLRQLRTYDDEVAGGLMVTEYLEFRGSDTVAAVIDDMRSNSEKYADYEVQYAYVTDEGSKLKEVLRMRDLLLAPAGKKVRQLMIKDPVSVQAELPLQDLRDLFEEHAFLGVPVTAADGELLGIVQRSAVVEALVDRSESTYQKSQGIVGGEELRSLPVLVRSSRRLAWLSVNIVLNVLAASVIAIHQGTLEKVIALAVFLPIISDMSGCSGNQAVAVSMRELSLGLVRPVEMFRVWVQEVSVGLINGIVLGLLVAGVAILWKGNAWLGLVVGVAMAVNTVVAVSIGGTVPLLLRRLNKDPALASGPILTTCTDMCGFMLVLTLASAMMSKLEGAM